MNEYEDKLEKASLLPDRYYIILKQGNAPDIFSVVAYDTNEHNEEYDIDTMPAGMAIQHGLLSYLKDSVSDVFDKGVAEIAFKFVADDMVSDIQEGKELLPKNMTNNVIKVDFGKKQ